MLKSGNEVGEIMNIISIVSDTLRRDHLGCYGNTWIRTPNIDKLAQQSVVFDDAYAASFPTVPHRRDFFTGRYTFTYSDWGPLPTDEVVLADVLRKSGYVTMLITDTPHILKDGYHFERGFDGWSWIRGQGPDRYITDPIDYRFPCDPKKLKMVDTSFKQYLRNVSRRQYETDFFTAQTMMTAAKWLERNKDHEKFFLHVDIFDPHEPWDPPRWYVDLYDPGYQGEEVMYPIYGPCDYLTADEIKHIRALYAGEVTMVDRWVGSLMEKVKDLGLWENTALIFTTDHGFYHGEHGLIGKTISSTEAHGLVPLYDEVAHIPMMIRLPETKPRRCEAFTQPPDLMPTILDIAKTKIPETVQGKSLLPLLEGDRPAWRKFAVASPSIIHGPVAGQRISVITKDWYFVYCGQIQDALEELKKPKEGEKTRPERTVKIVDGIERIQRILGEKPKNELYSLPEDALHVHDVFPENREVASDIQRRLVEFLKSLGTEQELMHYWQRLD